jgi:hypothetical protein
LILIRDLLNANRSQGQKLETVSYHLLPIVLREGFRNSSTVIAVPAE